MISKKKQEEASGRWLSCGFEFEIMMNRSLVCITAFTVLCFELVAVVAADVDATVNFENTTSREWFHYGGSNSDHHRFAYGSHHNHRNAAVVASIPSDLELLQEQPDRPSHVKHDHDGPSRRSQTLHNNKRIQLNQHHYSRSIDGKSEINRANRRHAKFHVEWDNERAHWWQQNDSMPDAIDTFRSKPQHAMYTIKRRHAKRHRNNHNHRHDRYFIDVETNNYSPTMAELLAEELDQPHTNTMIVDKVADKELVWPTKKEAIMEGDLILGGLMMVHSRDDSQMCGPIMPQGGIQALEAMLYTLDRINNDKKLLPNVTIGAHILDDCDRDSYGLEMAVDFIKGEFIFLSRNQ